MAHMVDVPQRDLRELVEEIQAIPAGPERQLVVAMLTAIERAYRDWCARQDSNPPYRNVPEPLSHHETR